MPAACKTRTFILGESHDESAGGAPPCSADESECSVAQDCCSGLCETGRCVALNTECLTRDNPCATSEECCSQLCESGRCSQAGSYCAQEGDTCTSGADCCSLSCDQVPGALYGTCAAAPNGPANCSDGIAGSVCSDCNKCCSRLCAPYGDSGGSICTGASGCRQTGEVCQRNDECCGGQADSELPGAGNVTCVIADGAEVGICRNAQSCSPQGNACHYADYVCSVSAASNRCCDGDGAGGECVLDEQGIPRCSGLGTTCRQLGESCAMQIDCCEGSCLPSSTGGFSCQESSRP